MVSKNDVWVEGAEHVLNNATYWDYAIKAPYKAPMMATIFLNPKHGIINQDRSVCYQSNTGNFVSFIRKNDSNGHVLLHETGGHGIAGLKDEYVESGYEEFTLSEEGQTELDNIWTSYGQGANVDWRNDESTVKWAHFLSDSRYANEGLGIYEGAYLHGHGAYRPTENSMMRYNDSPFNAPSREQIYKRIMKYSEGDSWTYDYEKFVEYDAINRGVAARSAVTPMTEAERQEYLKHHCPPVFVKGTWPDALKNEKSHIVIPLR